MTKLQRFLDGFDAIYNAIYFRFDLQDNISCTVEFIIGMMISILLSKFLVIKSAEPIKTKLDLEGME